MRDKSNKLRPNVGILLLLACISACSTGARVTLKDEITDTPPRVNGSDRRWRLVNFFSTEG